MNLGRSTHFIFSALLMTTTVAFAQVDPVEIGIKGGATFTHGHTTLPVQQLTATVQVPRIENKNNGIGTGYSFGIWGRKNFNTFFIQVEADYNSFVLKQKTNFSVAAGVAGALAGIPVPSIYASAPTTVNLMSTSTLHSINIPVLFGKRFLNEKLRVYLGPNFQYNSKASADRTTSGRINLTATQGIDVPASTATTDLTSENAGILRVQKFTYSAEVGIGYTFLNRIDIDARYAAPVGGVYRNNDIKGYLGIATLTAGIRLF